jgi:hypothetical protein
VLRELVRRRPAEALMALVCALALLVLVALAAFGVVR